MARLFSVLLFVLIGTLEGLAQTQPQSIVTYQGFTATRGSGNPDDLGGQGYDKLVDGLYSPPPNSPPPTGNQGEGEYWTKWWFPRYDLYKYPLPDGGNGNNNCYWVDFQADNPISIVSYVLTSCNDTNHYPGRNPKSWVLKGKLSENAPWTTIAEVSNDTTMGTSNFTDYDYLLDVPGTYRFFRFIVSEVQDEVYENGLQLGELRFRNVELLPTPSHLNSVVTTDDGLGAILSWDADDRATSWQVCVNDDEDNLIAVTANSCTLTDLVPDTTYTFKVRSLNDSYGLSEWSTTNTFMTTNDRRVTVGNGSTNCESIPVYGWYADKFQKNQFIFPASVLSNITAGDYITRLQFYAQNESASLGDTRFKVYVGEVDKSYFLQGEDFYDWNTLTEVYEGSVSVANNSMEILFDMPYQYQGGNLIVGFYSTNEGSYQHIYWYCDRATGTLGSQTTYPSRISNSQENGTALWLPKTTIFFSPTPSILARPTNLDFTLTQGDGTKATLSWTENYTATSWEICLNDDETNLIETNSNPFTFTRLTPDTRYTVKVRSVNGKVRSFWSEPVSFKPTDYYWITLYDGTETNDCVPVYGTKDDANSNSQFIIPSDLLSDISSDYYINRLTFYAKQNNVNWGNNQYEVYVALTKDMVFSRQSETSLYVTPNWTSTSWIDYTKVYEGTLSVSDYEMEITFNTPFQYQPFNVYNNLMIGIRQTDTSSTQTCYWYGVGQSDYTSIGGYFFVRNPNSSFVELKPFSPKVTIGYSPEDPRNAKKPNNLEVSYTGGTTAEVSWTSTETAWDIEVNGVVTEHVTSPYTLTNLDYAKKYEVRVRSRRDVSPAGFSDWTEPVSFITDLAEDGDWCRIAFHLSDSGGDGWNGNAIKVEDVLTGKPIDTVTVTGEPSAGEEQVVYVDVPDKRTIQFVWVKGEKSSECSWSALDVNNDEVCSSINIDVSSLEDGDTLSTYAVDCTVTPLKTPDNLTVRPLVSLAYVDWTERSVPAATQWILAYKSTEADEFTEVLVDEHPYALEGLNSATTYIVKVRPYIENSDVLKWSEEATFTMNSEYLVPSDLSAAIDENEQKATLTWTGNSAQYVVRYRKVCNFFEDFKNGIPSTWTTIDADNDGHNWYIYTYNGNPDGDVIDEELMSRGPNFLASESYSDDDGEALTPDNWLISPLVPLHGTMKLSVRSFHEDYKDETFSVYLSTIGNTIEALLPTVLIDETPTGSVFAEYTYDLSDYAGKLGFVAIRHHASTDLARLLVDNFGFYESNDWTTVTVDDLETFVEGLDGNSAYEFQVKGVSPDLPEGTNWSDVCTFFSYYVGYTMKGDVNRDNNLNILDVLAQVNIIKGRDTQEYNYDYDAADMDGNGTVEIIDVNALINLIKGR